MPSIRLLRHVFAAVLASLPCLPGAPPSPSATSGSCRFLSAASRHASSSPARSTSRCGWNPCRSASTWSAARPRPDATWSSATRTGACWKANCSFRCSTASRSPASRSTWTARCATRCRWKRTRAGRCSRTSCAAASIPGCWKRRRATTTSCASIRCPRTARARVRLRIVEALASRAGAAPVPPRARLRQRCRSFSLAMRARGCRRAARRRLAQSGRDPLRARRRRLHGTARTARTSPPPACSRSTRQAGAARLGRRIRRRALLLRRAAGARHAAPRPPAEHRSRWSGTARPRARNATMAANSRCSTRTSRACATAACACVRVRETVSAPEEFRVAGGHWRDAAHRPGADQLRRRDQPRRPRARWPASEETLLFSDGLANFGERSAPGWPAACIAVSAARAPTPRCCASLAEAGGGRYIDLLRNPAAAPPTCC